MTVRCIDRLPAPISGGCRFDKAVQWVKKGMAFASICNMLGLALAQFGFFWYEFSAKKEIEGMVRTQRKHHP